MHQPKAKEKELALKRNQRLQRELKIKYLSSLALAVLFGLTAAGVTLAGFVMAGFCLFVVALILGIHCFDSKGQLHEVRQRPHGSLGPDLSVVDKHASSPTQSTTSSTSSEQ